MDGNIPPVAEVVAKTRERGAGAVLDTKNSEPVAVAVDGAPAEVVVFS